MVFSLILPKCAKTREPKDEHCVSMCTYIYICNTLPLDNPKIYSHLALLYITKLIMIGHCCDHLGG